MRRHARRPRRLVGGLLGLGAAAALALAGCGRGPDDPPVGPVAVQVEDPKAPPPADAQPTPAQHSAKTDKLYRPFKEAVRLDPPDDERLLDKTCTGKSVGKLFQAVAGKNYQGGLWDQVPFVSAAGKDIKYRAVLTTALGEIHIDLYPQAAPNHVRSFVALARAGYFDGLPFYRSVRQADGGRTAVGLIEAGCPKGTGEFGYGSIGYWLRPEVNKQLTHEPGAVGAWHREELETAACRFYIAAEPMPQLDGSFTLFGKVSRGLDVVRTINTKAVTEDDRLREPVPIRTVVIQTLEDGAVVASRAP